MANIQDRINNMEYILTLESLHILLNQNGDTIPQDIYTWPLDKLYRFANDVFYNHYIETHNTKIWNKTNGNFIGSSIAWQFAKQPQKTLFGNKIYTLSRNVCVRDNSPSISKIPAIEQGLNMERKIIDKILPSLYPKYKIVKPGRMIYDKVPAFACSADVELRIGSEQCRETEEKLSHVLETLSGDNLTKDTITNIIEIKTLVGASADPKCNWLNSVGNMLENDILQNLLLQISRIWSNPPNEKRIVSITSKKCINPHKFLTNVKKELNLKTRRNTSDLITFLGAENITNVVDMSSKEKIEIFLFANPNKSEGEIYVSKHIVCNSSNFPLCINPLSKDFVQVLNQVSIYQSSKTIKNYIDVSEDLSAYLLLVVPWIRSEVHDDSPAALIKLPICITDTMINRYIQKLENCIISNYNDNLQIEDSGTLQLISK